MWKGIRHYDGRATNTPRTSQIENMYMHKASGIKPRRSHFMNDEIKEIDERDVEIYALVSELRRRMTARKIAKIRYSKAHPDTWLDDLLQTTGGTSLEEVEIYA